jgi:hypothetical protein
MTSAEHPQHEEVMAFLDGELTAASEADIRAHLDRCHACRSLAGDLRAVSDQLTAWRVEPVPATLDVRVKDAIRAATSKESDRRLPWRKMVPRWRWTSGRWTSGRWALAGAAAAVLAAAVLWRTADGGRPLRDMSPLIYRTASPAGVTSAPAAAMAGSPPPLPPRSDSQDAQSLSQEAFVRETLVGGVPDAASQADASQLASQANASQLASQANASQLARRDLTGGLLIARTATVHLLVADVDQARAVLERQLGSNQGYVSRLAVTGERPAARALVATVKVPTDQIDATLAVIRSLGRVQDESRGSEDVTAQSVDLDARLANARRTEQRLVAVLAQRTGKVSDVLEVEREIARVRGEIEQMEGSRKRLTTRIDFATIDLRFEEERHAGLTDSSPSVPSELRNAAVDGLRSAVECTIGLMLLLLRIGPTTALGAAALAWPLRALWRRRFRARVRTVPGRL